MTLGLREKLLLSMCSILFLSLAVSITVITVSTYRASESEISGNIGHASEGVGEVGENITHISAVSADISGDITQVSELSEQISTNSTQVNENADNLAGLSGRLKEILSTFKI